MLFYFCQHAAAADRTSGTGDPELRLCVLAEEGSDAGEMGQILGSNDKCDEVMMFISLKNNYCADELQNSLWIGVYLNFLMTSDISEEENLIILEFFTTESGSEFAA